VDTFAYDEITPTGTVSACGFSYLSLVVLLFSFLLLLAGVVFVSLWKMQMRLPVAGSCSLAISAACHASPDEVDPHLARLQWGVVEYEVVKGFKHCSLSSETVTEPEEGKKYY
jgi:hypothetical protein